MAFCMGYNLSREFRSISSTARIIVATLGRTTSKLHNVSCKANKRRSIAEHIVKCTARTQSSTTSILRATLTEYDQKIEAIRHLLTSKDEADPIERLMFVDAVQRLGVSHHFEEETDTILRRSSNRHGIHTTLYDVSLFFRLLRQQGHYVSSDVFDKFKGDDGKFRGELRHDVKGLMELFEAAQLSFEMESILEEAERFSHQSLNICMANMDDDYLRRFVGNKLRHPFQKSLSRFTSRGFYHDIGSMYEWGETLRELAAMDVEMARPVYQEEQLQVSTWWNDLGLCEELTLARNKPIEWHMWSMIMLIDYTNLSEQRVQLTKPIAFIYLIDDIFDAYGKPEELSLFSQAIHKWDYAAIDTLPDYMKMCYRALLDTTDEISHKIHEKYGYNPINTLKATWASLCDAYLVETKWFDSGILPNADEYLENGKVSSGVYVVLVHLFFLLGLGGSNGCNGCSISLTDTTELMSSVAKILRLCNDLGCAKDEHQNGKVGSYIECYMKDHKNLSLDQTQQHVLKMVAIEWKRLNKECCNINDISTLSLRRTILNLARMTPLMYNYNDQLQPVLGDYVKFMLFDQTSATTTK